MQGIDSLAKQYASNFSTDQGAEVLKRISKSYAAIDHIIDTGLTVIIPCFNEIDRTQAIIKKFEELYYFFAGRDIQWRIIISDDGSTNEFYASMSKLFAGQTLPDGRKLHEVGVMIALENNQLNIVPGLSKKGGAVRNAMHFVNDNRMSTKCEYVFVTDIDESVSLLQIGVDLALLYDEMADFIVGSRKLEKSIVVKDPARMGYGVKVLRHLQRLLLPEIYGEDKIQDTQAPYKMYSAKVIPQLLTDIDTNGFGIDLDIVMSATKHNLKVHVSPIMFYDVIKGSKVMQIGVSVWQNIWENMCNNVDKYMPERKKKTAAIQNMFSRVSVEQLVNLPVGTVDHIIKNDNVFTLVDAVERSIVNK